MRSRRRAFRWTTLAPAPPQQSPLQRNEPTDTPTPTPTLTPTILEMLRIMGPVLPQFRSHVINVTRCGRGAVRRFACMCAGRGHDAPQGRGYSIYQMASRRNKINMTSVVTVILAVTAGVVTFRETFGATTAYTVSELSGAGDTGRVPCRLNNLGDVAGRAGDSLSGETRATIWNHHGSLRPTNLGNLAGGEYSSAAGINDAGEVAGAANTAKSIVPFVWTPVGGLRRIPLLPGDNCGQAFGINKYGHVAGYSSGPKGRKAFLWTQSAGVRNLGVLPGGNYSTACDVNDLDEVAGTSASAAGDRAVLWTKTGNLRDLGTLPGDKSSEASAINNNGDVVGYSKGPRGMRAFLWTQATGMQDLGVLPGGNSSRALGINDMGAVVGSSTSSSGDRAFIWTKQAGMRDLNSATSVSPGVVLVEAHAINYTGQILVMWSSGTHGSHGSGEAASQCAPAPPSSFLLTPSPQ
jgi:probable HAF family extracellular repeat protein